jgi:hypothetical protein
MHAGFDERVHGSYGSVALSNRRAPVTVKKKKPAASSGDAQVSAEHALTPVNTRLFAADVTLIKKIAAERGIPWQIELRLLVRRALKGETREVVMLKE